MTFMHMQRVATFINRAAECSVYVAPEAPGLDYQEIIEIGQREGFQAGEINDALQNVLHFWGQGRYLPDINSTGWEFFVFREDPDYRDVRAFDFIHSQFNDLKRAAGGQKAALDRSVLIERGVAAGLDRHGLEVAVAIMLITGQLVEKADVLRTKFTTLYEPLPSAQLAQGHGGVHRKPDREHLLPVVTDVVRRRSDGRPAHADALKAFPMALDKLGYAPAFRTWWAQTASEMQTADPERNPITATVLSAALVEGALAFVVSHAKARQLGVFQSKTFEGDPRQWKIDDLVGSAASGGQSAILSPSDRARVDALITERQRIHAGRMLSVYPKGPPDLRPEMARDAKATAELVVRRVLDWHEKFP